MTIRVEGLDASTARREIDWTAIERSPEFRELVARRRRFVVPATAFFLTSYLGFILLCGYAPKFMGKSLYEAFTVGWGIALAQFVMVWALVALYNRTATRVFDPLRERVVERALGGIERRTGRFDRTQAPAPEREGVTR
jgi:uncharacterized membrane protein (DUF485 family)